MIAKAVKTYVAITGIIFSILSAEAVSAQSSTYVLEPSESAWLNSVEIFETIGGVTQKGFFQNQEHFPGYFIETHERSAKTRYSYTDPRTGKLDQYDGIWSTQNDEICYYYQEDGEIVSHCQFVRQYENCLFFYTKLQYSNQSDFSASDWLSVRYDASESPKCLTKES